MDSDSHVLDKLTEHTQQLADMRDEIRSLSEAADRVMDQLNHVKTALSDRYGDAVTVDSALDAISERLEGLEAGLESIINRTDTEEVYDV